jgi:putative tryptophan/tyrosine transport system substrate-binding protein
MALEFKAATDIIPVVAVVADPVAFGIISNLARPGGNITGVSVDGGVEILGKRLELLREIVPTAAKVAYLASRRLWEAPDATALREAAQRLKIALIGPPLDAPIHDAEYRRVLAAMSRDGADALVVGDQVDNTVNRRLIVELAENVRLPAIYPYRDFIDSGGLIAYSVEIRDILRHSADQIDEIIKGAKPGDIPFYQPIKFVLTLNLKTAKALGITVPPTLLIAADEVIE